MLDPNVHGGGVPVGAPRLGRAARGVVDAAKCVTPTYSLSEVTAGADAARSGESPRVHMFTIAWGLENMSLDGWCECQALAALFNDGHATHVHQSGTEEGLLNSQKKIHLLIEHLSSLDGDTFVVFVDGADVFTNRPLDRLYDLFLSFDAKVVVSGEQTCMPSCAWCHEWGEQAQGHPSPYPNSGVIMGLARHVLAVVQRMRTYQEQDAVVQFSAEFLERAGRGVGCEWNRWKARADDQMWMHMVVWNDAEELGIRLDTQSRMVLVLRKYAQDEMEWLEEEHGWKPLVLRELCDWAGTPTCIVPFFIHTAGRGWPSSGRWFERVLQEQSLFESLQSHVSKLENSTIATLCRKHLEIPPPMGAAW
eukprot:TRINITY_DN21467_c0_g1_i1.p1 TRINITY_DN21467_c0_g1~~TRINITY_DN21467_c0_g1_i1.p1  ORF type:complete len:419 (-),score=118.65 TRINITY_DN21467_c0_g1_i1:128-1219(-)